MLVIPWFDSYFLLHLSEFLLMELMLPISIFDRCSRFRIPCLRSSLTGYRPAGSRFLYAFIPWFVASLKLDIQYFWRRFLLYWSTAEWKTIHSTKMTRIIWHERVILWFGALSKPLERSPLLRLSIIFVVGKESLFLSLQLKYGANFFKKQKTQKTEIVINV